MHAGLPNLNLISYAVIISIGNSVLFMDSWISKLGEQFEMMTAATNAEPTKFEAQPKKCYLIKQNWSSYLSIYQTANAIIGLPGRFFVDFSGFFGIFRDFSSIVTFDNIVRQDISLRLINDDIYDYITLIKLSITNGKSRVTLHQRKLQRFLCITVALLCFSQKKLVWENSFSLFELNSPPVPSWWSS